MGFDPLPDGRGLRILFVYPNVQRIKTPQLGIAVLSACVKRIGAETKLFDTTRMQKGREREPFRKILREYEPHIVAYSVRSTEWLLVKDLLAIGRSMERLQIAGGPHVTHAPEEVIPLTDALVIGEGEGAMLDLTRAVARGEPLAGIRNTWVSTEQGVVKTPKRHLIRDLDAIPLPDWCLFDRMHYEESFLLAQAGRGAKAVAAIEGSRGCPFTCTYCSNPALMEGYRGHGPWRREKSPERMVEELETFRQSFGQLDFVYWVDEIWLTGTERLRRFRDLYKSHIGVPFSIMERPECITEEKMALIADAGLTNMAIGLESGDEQLRADLLDRRTSIDVLEQAFILPKKHGVKVHAFTMVGLPGQDETSLMKTWSFMRKVRPDTAQFTFFFPLKGTRLYEQSVRAGLYNPRETVESYHARSVLRQDDVIDPERLGRYHRLLSAYAACPGGWSVLAFHLCRKSRRFYCCLFILAPWLRREIAWQTRRLHGLLRGTPGDALRRILHRLMAGRNTAKTGG